jgi:hypothetical protein
MNKIESHWLNNQGVLDEKGQTIIDEKVNQSFMKRIGNPWFKGNKVFDKMTF